MCRRRATRTDMGARPRAQNTHRHWHALCSFPELCIHTHPPSEASTRPLHLHTQAVARSTGSQGIGPTRRPERAVGRVEALLPPTLPTPHPHPQQLALLLQFLHLLHSPLCRQRLSKHFRLVY